MLCLSDFYLHYKLVQVCFERTKKTINIYKIQYCCLKSTESELPWQSFPLSECFLGECCPRPLLLRLSRFVSQVLVLTFGDRYTFQKLLLLFSSQLRLIICFYASFIEIIIELYEWALQLLLHGLCSFKREKEKIKKKQLTPFTREMSGLLKKWKLKWLVERLTLLGD